MARTVEVEKLEKVTLNLYKGDLDRLNALYPDLDKSVALRRVLRSILDATDRAAAQGSTLTLKIEV